MDFTLTVNPQELRAISDALGELKYSVAKPLIDKLNGQLAAQAPKLPEPEAQVEDEIAKFKKRAGKSTDYDPEPMVGDQDPRDII